MSGFKQPEIETHAQAIEALAEVLEYFVNSPKPDLEFNMSADEYGQKIKADLQPYDKTVELEEFLCWFDQD